MTSWKVKHSRFEELQFLFSEKLHS